MDSEGKITSSLGNGQYLMFGATYYGNNLFGGPCILAEPNNITTMEVASAIR